MITLKVAAIFGTIFMENKTNSSYTRYSYGVNVLTHKGINTTTSVGSEFDDFLLTLDNADSRQGRVPKFAAYRPDTIARLFYGSPGYWWYPLQFNSYFDPFEALSPGDTINIPELL